jgi:Asp-tRNA(Asn)/Glu-tRNA(Gln) amidotransferase A subunit family amidase
LRICRHGTVGDDQSAQSRIFSRRFLERIGRGGCRLHGAGGARHADRRVGAAAIVLLWDFRLQADLQHFQQSRRVAGRRKHRHDRLAGSRSIDDIALLTAVVGTFTPRPRRALDTAPRIGLCRTELWDTALPETKAAVEGAALALGKAGAAIREVELPQAFAGLAGLARGTINYYERAACMASLWDRHRADLSPQMRRYIENGQKTSRDEYVAAWRRVEECRTLLPAVFEGLDVLLLPCVTGEAPKGLELTGDPSMQAMWTALHTPTMTLPTHRGPNNMPVGIQLAAQRYDDERLFAVAGWIWDKIGAPDLVGVAH